MRPFAPLLLLAALAGCGPAKPTTTTTGTAAIGGPFHLHDQNGRAVSERDLVGRPSLIFFGYTYCPEVCPTTLADLTRWLKALGPDADKLQVLYVTVDPQRDTAAQLKQYLSAFDPRIRGLTGTPAEVDAITKAYRVYAKRVPLANGDYEMDHSTMVYMMNARGEFVGPIGYQEPDAQVLPLLRQLIGPS